MEIITLLNVEQKVRHVLSLLCNMFMLMVMLRSCGCKDEITEFRKVCPIIYYYSEIINCLNILSLPIQHRQKSINKRDVCLWMYIFMETETN